MVVADTRQSMHTSCMEEDDGVLVMVAVLLDSTSHSPLYPGISGPLSPGQTQYTWPVPGKRHEGQSPGLFVLPQSSKLLFNSFSLLSVLLFIEFRGFESFGHEI